VNGEPRPVCSACGTSNAPGAHFCASCGAQLAAGDVPTVGDAARPVPPPPQSAAAPAPNSGNGRGRDIALWTAIALVGIAIVVALVVALQSRDHGSKPAVPATTQAPPETTAATTTTVFRAPVTTAPTRLTVPGTTIGQQAMLRRLAAIMDDSEIGRTIVHDAIPAGILANCRVSAADAVRSLDAAIANRQSLVTRLDRLDARVASPRLVRLLRDALDLSLQADRLFQRWLESNAADSGVPCDRETPDHAAANAVSDQSTIAKRAFLAAYNPQAARAGLRSDWTVDDF
jgi:hypothetical protein